MPYRLRRVWYRLGRLKIWQKTLLVALLVGVVSGFSVAYGGASSGSGGEAGIDGSRLYTVQHGDLTSSIYASGNLVYSTSEQLTFESAGTVEGVYVENDDTVKQGEVLARLDSKSIESLEEAVAQARINLRDAQEGLENAQNPYSEPDIAEARDAVERAQAELLDAQERGPIRIADAQYEIEKAQGSYGESISKFMGGKISLSELEQAERSLEIAELNLEMVKLNVDNSLSDAESKLANAEENLQEMLDGADSLVIALKQSELASARAAQDDALAQLELAKEGYPVVAPFDGVVANINVEPGDEVNANTVVIELVDSSAFEVSAIVDEIDVAMLTVGQPATLILDAIPDRDFSGNVSSISAFAQSQSGVVSYPITVSLATPDDVQLREGMSATATIEIELSSNALLVPSSAIGGTGNTAMIMVMVDGQPQPRLVTLGATDGVQTEVVTGLEEGDEVIVEVETVHLERVRPASESLPEGFSFGGG